MSTINYANLPTAPYWRRLAALAYDTLLLMAISLGYFGIVTAISYALGLTSEHSDYQVSYDKLTGLFLFIGWISVIIGFYGLFWRRNGQTLGMQAWKIRVQRLDGSYISWKQVIRRCAASIIVVTCYLGLHALELNTHWSIAAIIVFATIAPLPWSERRSINDQLSRSVTVQVPKDQRIGKKSGGVF